MSPLPRVYATDLSDAEWTILEPLVPPTKPGGRPRKWPMRTIMDGIFYVVRCGCQWRLLPSDFPPWQTVYHYFITLTLSPGRLHNAVTCELAADGDATA